MNRLARRIIGVLVSAMSAISFSSEACAQLFDNYTDAEQFGKDRLQALRKENVAHPMQYVVLKKDASLVKGLNPYTVYEIRAVLDLDAATLEIPAHCVIIFNGGAFKNGTLVGNDTKYCLKQAYSKCFQCGTDGTFEKIDYVIKATDAGMTANSPSRANANYSRLKSLITEGKNVFFDGKFYVNFSSPVVLKRVAHLYGGEMVYKKNAFQFANGGGIVVCGTVITASNDARSSFFIGAKDLLGAIDIKAISFQGCTIDCPYLVNVLYKDMNSDSVSFGVRCIDVDHCVFKDTGRFRVMDAVIAGRCSFTNNDYQKCQ